MTTTQVTNDDTQEPSAATTVAMRFEVTTIPVADVDRAKAFYTRLGWRLDADFTFGDHARGVQFTPPGSSASIQFGSGRGTQPGPLERLYLIVDDIQAARAELTGHGVEVSDIWHAAPGKSPEPGRDPEGRSYLSFASFSDPDGNTWLLQEVTERLPGRVAPTDVPALARLLHETAEHHDAFEKAAPTHDWWDWYAAYLDARQHGGSPATASAVADSYMAEVKHVMKATP